MGNTLPNSSAGLNRWLPGVTDLTVPPVVTDVAPRCRNCGAELADERALFSDDYSDECFYEGGVP